MPNIPDSIKQLILQLPFGKNLPPPSGSAEEMQNPANIIGRAMGGTFRDVHSARGKGLDLVTTPQRTEQDVIKNLISGATGLDFSQLPIANTPNAQAIVPPPQSAPVTPQVTPQVAPQTEKSTVPNKFMQFLKSPEFLKTLPQLIAAGVGLGSKGARPGATGFATGYGGGLEKEKERKLEREKAGVKTETDKWNWAYNAALELLDTGMGIEAVSPAELERKTQEIYNLRYGVQKAGANVPPPEMVTIEFADGVKQEMTEKEARNKGYLK